MADAEEHISSPPLTDSLSRLAEAHLLLVPRLVYLPEGYARDYMPCKRMVARHWPRA